MRKPRKTVLERTKELAEAANHLRVSAIDYAAHPTCNYETWLINAAFDLVAKARAFAKQGAKDGG